MLHNNFFCISNFWLQGQMHIAKMLQALDHGAQTPPAKKARPFHHCRQEMG